MRTLYVIALTHVTRDRASAEARERFMQSAMRRVGQPYSCIKSR